MGEVEERSVDRLLDRKDANSPITDTVLDARMS